jgi:type IV pilus assembly protein PilN
LPVAFEIRAPFSSLTPARQLQVLRLLGAEGMARRLTLLQREGVL